MEIYILLFLLFARIASAKCTHDNCARAVIGVHQDHSVARDDCSSFLEVTLTPLASTVLTTVTSVVNATTTFQPAKRQATGIIPVYASNCVDAEAYVSACSCFGVKPETITAPFPVTTITITALTTNVPTITIPTSSFTCYTNSSTTSSASPTISTSPNCTASTFTDPKNCGFCGNVCQSGVCEDGICSSAQCEGQTCGNITNCNGRSTCFCFTSNRNGTHNGFCGQNAVCSGLTPCANNFDCAGRNSTGDKCAIRTCCSAPSVAKPGVCLKSVCPNPAANLKIASVARRWIGGTAADGFRHG